MGIDDVVEGSVSRHAFLPGNIDGQKCMQSIRSLGGTVHSCGLYPHHALHFPVEPANLPAPRLPADDVTPMPIQEAIHKATADMARGFFEDCAKLMEAKDAAYGGAWQRQGWMGNLARLMSKMARLENMLWTDERPRNEQLMRELGESVEDTLRDIANLSYFMFQNREDGNKWGR